jgi:hypothetical protein
MKQTAPLEQPVNTASSASLPYQRNDINNHTRPSNQLLEKTRNIFLPRTVLGKETGCVIGNSKCLQYCVEQLSTV